MKIPEVARKLAEAFDKNSPAIYMTEEARSQTIEQLAESIAGAMQTIALSAAQCADIVLDRAGINVKPVGAIGLQIVATFGMTQMDRTKFAQMQLKQIEASAERQRMERELEETRAAAEKALLEAKDEHDVQ